MSSVTETWNALLGAIYILNSRSGNQGTLIIRESSPAAIEGRSLTVNTPPLIVRRFCVVNLLRSTDQIAVCSLSVVTTHGCIIHLVLTILAGDVIGCPVESVRRSDMLGNVSSRTDAIPACVVIYHSLGRVKRNSLAANPFTNVCNAQSTRIISFISLKAVPVVFGIIGPRAVIRTLDTDGDIVLVSNAIGSCGTVVSYIGLA